MTSVSLGLWVGVGGRHEPKKLNGICQFFDAHADDEWELIEGEFFEPIRQSNREP